MGDLRAALDGAGLRGLTDVAGEDDEVLHGGSPEISLKGPSFRQDPAEARRETSARETRSDRKPLRAPGGAGGPGTGQHGPGRSWGCGQEAERT